MAISRAVEESDAVTSTAILLEKFESSALALKANSVKHKHVKNNIFFNAALLINGF
jgi:hypothetical protein